MSETHHKQVKKAVYVPANYGIMKDSNRVLWWKLIEQGVHK